MKNEITTKQISDYLETYLNGTRLSMRQVAKKWGVSPTLLSQIKNNKKSASLDLSLRILREAKASVKEREAFIKNQYEDSAEVAQLYCDVEKQRNELRIQERYSELLENDTLLMDVLMDISFAGESGLTSQTIILEYGKLGLKKAETLLSADLVELVEGRYRKKVRDVPLGMTASASLGFMKGVFANLKDRVQKDEFRGEFHFDLSDVSEEAYEEIKTLQKEFTKNVIKIIKENEMARVKGGRRIVFQNLISWMKCFVFIFIVGQADYSYAGGDGNGVTGGASGLVLEVRIQDLISTTLDNRSFNGKTFPHPVKYENEDDEKIEVSYKKGAVATVEFNTEEEVVKYLVNVNKTLSTRPTDIISNPYGLNKLMIGGISNCKFGEIAFKKENSGILDVASIKPVGFKVEKIYTPSGETRYRGVNNLYVPCEVRMLKR